MRPWDTFSAREADDFDYDGLADALKPDWSLLDRHYWRRDFKRQFGNELEGRELDRHAELASAVLGKHPDLAATHAADDASQQFARPNLSSSPDFNLGYGSRQELIQPLTKSPGFIPFNMGTTDEASPSSSTDVQMPPASAQSVSLPESFKVHSTAVSRSTPDPTLPQFAPLAPFPSARSPVAALSPASHGGSSFNPREISGIGTGLFLAEAHVGHDGVAIAGLGGRGGKPPRGPAPPPKSSEERPPPGAGHNRPPEELSPQGWLPAAIEWVQRSFDSQILARNMRRRGIEQGEGTATHHIVASRHRYGEQARQVLKKFEIDVNDADNGVFLPANKNSPNPEGAIVHSTMHTKQYFDAVTALLQVARSKQEALWILSSIRLDLQSGKLPN